MLKFLKCIFWSYRIWKYFLNFPQGDFVADFFWFHVVKPLMTILPILCVGEKTDYSAKPTHNRNLIDVLQTYNGAIQTDWLPLKPQSTSRRVNVDWLFCVKNYQESKNHHLSCFPKKWIVSSSHGTGSSDNSAIWEEISKF